MKLRAALSIGIFLAAPFLIAQKIDKDKDDVLGRGPGLARRPGVPRAPATPVQQPIPTPTGFSITPTAAPGSVFTTMNPNLPGLPNYTAGQPMTTAVSPDGKTLLVLTSGYNLLNDSNGKNLAAAGNEYVFIYDISTDKLVQLGVVPIPAAYAGIAWNPNGKEFYISGGAGDLVLVITAGAGGFALGGTVSMAHPNPTGLGSGNGLGMPSIVAGMAVNASGNRLLVANMLNDSVTLVDIPNRKKLTELDLRPGVIDPSKTAVAGGEYPFWVAIKGDNKAYVSSLRDREIVVLSLAGDQPTVTTRIPVQGNPNKMILDKSQSRLLVTEDNAGLSIRNYGFYLDLIRYQLPAPFTAVNIPPSTTPFVSGIVQAIPANAALAPYTDPYFRGFDNAWPDYYRYQEWAREFDQYVVNGNLPNLSFVRFMHDHTGNFDTAQFGVNTPEVQIADNDYAVGLLLEHLAKSPDATNTLVFVIEDDAQDGPDHVDAHRSIAFVAGPYVKQGAVVSTRYNTVNFVRTIKDVLGIPYYGLTDGTAEPMADLFDMTQTTWKYSSLVPGILRTATTLPLPAATAENGLPNTRQNRAALKPRHDAKWWAKRMSGQDFDKEDDLDTPSYNHVLWLGMMGRKPYPEARDGADLRENREQLLKNLK